MILTVPGVSWNPPFHTAESSSSLTDGPRPFLPIETKKGKTLSSIKWAWPDFDNGWTAEGIIIC